MKKLFEEYVESADYVISVFFKELDVQVQKWFNEGSLGASGCQLVQVTNNEIMNPIQKYQMIEFISPENYFQIMFIVRIDEMTDDNEIGKVYLKIKKYSDNETQKLERELDEEIDVEDVKEDFIIDKISELDKSDEEEKEDVDLKDNIYDK